MEKKANVAGEEYFNNTEELVTRGELNSILEQVLKNIESELEDSFKRVVSNSNTLDVVVLALQEKGLITEDELKEAKDTIVKTYNDSLKKEGDKDGKE